MLETAALPFELRVRCRPAIVHTKGVSHYEDAGSLAFRYLRAGLDTGYTRCIGARWLLNYEARTGGFAVCVLPHRTQVK